MEGWLPIALHVLQTNRCRNRSGSRSSNVVLGHVRKTGLTAAKAVDLASCRALEGHAFSAAQHRQVLLKTSAEVQLSGLLPACSSPSALCWSRSCFAKEVFMSKHLIKSAQTKAYSDDA